MSLLIDLLLVPTEGELEPPAGEYDAVRGYTLHRGQPLVASIDLARTGTETRVGGEPRDPDAWAATTTVTKISREDNDRD